MQKKTRPIRPLLKRLLISHRPCRPLIARQIGMPTGHPNSAVRISSPMTFRSSLDRPSSHSRTGTRPTSLSKNLACRRFRSFTLYCTTCGTFSQACMTEMKQGCSCNPDPLAKSGGANGKDNRRKKVALLGETFRGNRKSNFLFGYCACSAPGAEPQASKQKRARTRTTFFSREDATEGGTPSLPKEALAD